MRQLLSILTLASLVLLSACGGGGGSSNSSASTTPSTSAAGSNVVPITIGAGPVVNGTPTTSPNIPFVTVTVCVPGTSTCTQVDHIQLDTGSAGLRLVNTQAVVALGLPAQSAPNGNALGECAQFADGVTWGAVRTADVKIASETASAIPIEIIGDTSIPGAPADCTANGATKQTVTALGANGLLGVGTLVNDCGLACAQQALSVYFACTSSACAATTVPVASQVPNPVARFANNNNGTLVQMPAIPAGGSATAQGSLIFGIGTQSNNAIASGVTVYSTNSAGQFTATYNGTALRQSLLDTGSNGLFFPDTTITPCPTTSTSNGFFCPASTTAVSATITGVNGATTTAGLSIANAQLVFASGNFAYNDIGGPFPGTTFDFGLPFFYGRSVYTAITGAQTSGGVGPYVAF